MDYKIISVESRKGGVGKTTAALNLATVLLEKNYAVLFLDVDITGTSIMGAFKSSYWKDIVNPIKEKGKDINLLRLFQEKFLIGENVPTFSKNINENWKIDVSKINILQFEICQSDSNIKFECDPRILFDELHSYWLTNMLKSICDNFNSIVKNDNSLKKEVVIILDNSPGFVGLAKSIHEWLFEIGPENGKFLSISSLDNQDLTSSLQAIEDIDNTIAKKKKAIEIFKEIKNHKSNITSIPEDVKDLIVKFATVADEKLFKNFNYTSLSNYQALIVNKVPSIISNKTLLYNFSELGFKNNTVSELLYSKSTSKIRNYVNFDNNINFQFVEAFLSKKPNNRRSGIWRILKDRINENSEKSFDMEKPNGIQVAIENYEQAVQNIYRLLQRSEWKYLTEIIDIKWFPKTPFQDLSDNFKNLISDYPFRPMMGMHRVDINRHEDDYLTRKIEKYNISNFSELGLKTNDIAIALIRYLLHSYDFQDIKMEETISSLFLTVLEIQSYRYHEKNKNQTYKQFLASEDIEDINESIDLVHKIRDSTNNHIMPMDFENISFGDFYNSFCHAQARLIDLFDDYRFLLYTLELIISKDLNSERIVFPNINDTLNQVIIDKSIPHSKAKEKLVESINVAKYMGDFKKELQSISKEWALIK